jgi:hypothetical protein
MMLSFRERVLEPFFTEAEITARAYYDKKGLRRTSPRASLGFDTVDQIVITLARGLRKRSQIFDTFGYLYHCYQIKDVQEDLGHIGEKDTLEPLKRETVLKYEKEAIKFLHTAINRDSKIKEDIINAIRKEYGSSENK